MSAPSPDLFLEAALAYQKTASIKAAIALDLFTAIAQEEGVLDRVAARVGAASGGVRILCDYLTVHGFLEKHDSNYSPQPLNRTVSNDHVSGRDGERRAFPVGAGSPG